MPQPLENAAQYAGFETWTEMVAWLWTASDEQGQSERLDDGGRCDLSYSCAPERRGSDHLQRKYPSLYGETKPADLLPKI